MIVEYENEKDMQIALELQLYLHVQGVKEFTVRASKEFYKKLRG